MPTGSRTLAQRVSAPEAICTGIMESSSWPVAAVADALGQAAQRALTPLPTDNSLLRPPALGR